MTEGTGTSMVINTGDFITAYFNFSDNQEKFKARPVFVLDIDKNGIATYCFCSSKKADEKMYAHDVLISEQDASKVKLNKATRIDLKKVRKSHVNDLSKGKHMGNMTALGPKFLNSLLKALKHA